MGTEFYATVITPTLKLMFTLFKPTFCSKVRKNVQGQMERDLNGTQASRIILSTVPLAVRPCPSHSSSGLHLLYLWKEGSWSRHCWSFLWTLILDKHLETLSGFIIYFLILHIYLKIVIFKWHWSFETNEFFSVGWCHEISKGS